MYARALLQWVVPSNSGCFTMTRHFFSVEIWAGSYFKLRTLKRILPFRNVPYILSRDNNRLKEMTNWSSCPAEEIFRKCTNEIKVKYQTSHTC